LAFAATTHAAIDLHTADVAKHAVSNLTPAQGGTFVVSFEVGNRGTQDATAATVSFYLSTNATWQATDPALATRLPLPVIGAGRAVNFSSPLTMSQAGGPWYLIWVLDDRGESNPGDNTVVYARTLTAGPPPAFDLSDAGLSYRNLSSRNVLPGGSFDMMASVENAGTASSGIFRISYRLSPNATLGDADDIQLAARNFNALPAPAPRLPSIGAIDRTLTVPAGTAPGTYRFGYIIEAAADSNQSNNTQLFGGNFTVDPPPTSAVDLVDAGAGWWSVVPNQYVFAQQPLMVSGAVRNAGTSPSGPFTLTFFASTDAITGDADDIVLKTENFPALAAYVPGFNLRTFQVQVPSTLLTAGTYYRIGWTISGGNDGNTANNVTLTTGSILPIPPPAIQFAGTWIVGGELNNHWQAQIRFTGLLRNNGSTERKVTVEAEFRRENEVDPVWKGRLWNGFDENGREVEYEDAHFTLPANETITFDEWIPSERFRNHNWLFGGFIKPLQFTLPADFLDVTLRIYDFETDTLLATQEVAQPKRIIEASKADLAAELGRDRDGLSGADFPALSFSTGAVQPGGSFTVRDVVIHNLGKVDAPASHARFYANDTPISPHLPVAEIGRWRRPTVWASEQLNENPPFIIPDTEVTVPASVGTGEVVIYVVTDSLGVIEEDSEQNNRRPIGTVAVGFQPDLKDEGLAHREIPEALLPGVAATFKVRVRNFGVGAAGSFNVQAHLLLGRTAAALPANLLNTVTVPSLAPLGTVDTRFNFTIPSGTAHGDYYLAWNIDAGGTVIETTETNNFYTSGPVRIGPAVNLKAGSMPFTLDKIEVTQGGTVQLTGSRANSGTSAATTHRNWILFSQDFQVTSGDLVVANTTYEPAATPAHSDLNFAQAINIGTSFAPGLYYVGYLFDSGNQVGEIDELDNLVRLPGALLVVAPLPPTGPPPLPEILEISREKRGVWLLWTSRKDLEYGIAYSENGSRWEPLLTQVGSPLTTGIYVPDDPAARRRLFRIEAKRP